LVRVVKNLLCPIDYKLRLSHNHSLGPMDATRDTHSSGNMKSLSRNEESIVSVHFDDIKWIGSIPVQNDGSGKLVAKIQSEGMTKVLKISPDESFISTEFKYGHDFTASQIDALDILKLSVDGLSPASLKNDISANALDKNILKSPQLTNFQDVLYLRVKQTCDEIANLQYRLLEAQRHLLDVNTDLLASVLSFESVLGCTITHKDQILVHVLEGKNLKSSDMHIASPDSYCEIYLKGNLLQQLVINFNDK
jgi:hypothetical protein